MDVRDLESKSDDQLAEEFVQGMISEAKAAGLDNRAIRTELGEEVCHYVDMSKIDRWDSNPKPHYNPWIITMIKELIRQHADLTVMKPHNILFFKNSLLDRAVMANNLEVVKVLLEAGMTIWDLHHHQYRPIFEYDKWDLLQLLMPEPLPQDYIDSFATTDNTVYELGYEPWSPCRWAVKFRKYNYLKFLISRGFNIESEFMPVLDYQRLHSALYCAAYRCNWELTRTCLELGANIFSTTELHQVNYPLYEVPFTVAIELDHEIPRELAKKYLIPEDINACDPSGERKELSAEGELYAAFTGPTMLHLACCTKSIESVKLLVELGADVNKVVDGYLPIQLAIILGQYKTAEFLYPLTKMSKEDWTGDQLEKAYNTYLCAPQYRRDLDHIPRLGEEGVFRYLLDAGAQMERTDDFVCKINWGESHIVQAFNVTVYEGVECYALWNALDHENDDAPHQECVKAILHCNPDMTLTRRLGTSGDRLNSSRYGNNNVEYVKTTAMQEAILTRDLELITVCVNAGCCLLNNQVVLKHVGEAVTSRLELHILEMLDRYDNSPRSLLHLAKFGVRRCLGHKDVDSKIDCLEIPTILRRYLKDIGC